MNVKNRTLVINSCDNCPFYNNEYYSYDEECMKLHRRIDTSKEDIPDDCPLDATEEDATE